MPGETVIRALHTIVSLQKANQNSVKCDFITSHPSFELLCRHLKRVSTMFTTDELVNSFKFLCSLHVPTNSEISLVLLNLMRHEINNLSVAKIIHLDYILSQTECRSELQKTIQTSLPIVFDLQLPQQIDRENSVEELIRILNYISTHTGIDAKHHNLTTICKLLCSKSKEFQLSDAINIIYRLCAIDRFHLRNNITLMTICIRRIMENIAEINIDELQKVIGTMCFNIINQYSPYEYHLHSLLNSTAERISQEDLGLPAALTLQKNIRNIVSNE